MAGRLNVDIEDLSSGTSVNVYNVGTKTLASLFTDRTAAVAAANPIVVNPSGTPAQSVFAAEGDYDINFLTIGGLNVTYTVTIREDPVIDPEFTKQAIAISSGSAFNIDASKGGLVEITLGANAGTPTIINPSAGQELIVDFIQDATGSRTYTWPASCLFAGGAAPAASTAASRKDRVIFAWDGTNWVEMSRDVGIH